MRNKLNVTVFFFLFILSNSCNKYEMSCYDEQTFQNHKEDICNIECPGVRGCDGNTYCNECEALKHGIRVEGGEGMPR